MLRSDNINFLMSISTPLSRVVTTENDAVNISQQPSTYSVIPHQSPTYTNEAGPIVTSPFRSYRLRQQSFTHFTQCDLLRIERAEPYEYYIHGPGDPSDNPEARSWLLVYTTLETGFIVATYFFLLSYWSIPFLLPAMIIAQLLLQFILLLYSDFFCRTAYKITFRCPNTTNYRSFFCSICDWLLVFCFFVSWCSAIIVIAPVFDTWHRFQVYPSVHDLKISSITDRYYLQSKSSLYFHSGVYLNMSSAAATFIHTSVPPWAYDALSEPSVTSTTANISTDSTIAIDSSPSILDPDFSNPRSLPTFFKTQFNSLHAYSDDPKYAHRLWPNLWLGTIRNATAGVALLSDNWLTLLEDKLKRKRKEDYPNVWSVCSDAATLNCNCDGLSLSRIIDPPKCTDRLCGVEMSSGMAVYSSISLLVKEAKRLLHMSPKSTDIFICLMDPEELRTQVNNDMLFGFAIGIPFSIALTFVSLRLLAFYLFQFPPTPEAEPHLSPLSNLL